MKKWQRNLLIAATILIAAGIAVSIIGLVLGASLSDAITSGLFSYPPYTFRSDVPQKAVWNENAAENGRYEISEPIHSIQLDWTAGSAELLVDDDADAVVLEEVCDGLQEDESLRYSVFEGTLYVEYCRKEGLHRNLPEKALAIRLPKEIADSLVTVRMDTVSADLTANNVTVSSAVSLDSTSGDISFTGSFKALEAESTSGNLNISCQGSADEVTVSAVSGDILVSGNYGELELSTTSGAISFDGTVQELEAETTSGEVSITGNGTFSEMNVNTTSGDVSLTLPETTGFSLEFDTGSGALNSELPLTMQDDQLCVGDGTADVEISTTSGDLSLYMP